MATGSCTACRAAGAVLASAHATPWRNTSANWLGWPICRPSPCASSPLRSKSVNGVLWLLTLHSHPHVQQGLARCILHTQKKHQNDLRTHVSSDTRPLPLLHQQDEHFPSTVLLSRRQSNCNHCRSRRQGCKDSQLLLLKIHRPRIKHAGGLISSSQHGCHFNRVKRAVIRLAHGPPKRRVRRTCTRQPKFPFVNLPPNSVNLGRIKTLDPNVVKPSAATR